MTPIPSLDDIRERAAMEKQINKQINRITVTGFCRQIRDIVQSGRLARVQHHLGDSYLARDAKPLGFGTSSAMIKLDKGGWVVVDPQTNKVLPTDWKA